MCRKRTLLKEVRLNLRAQIHIWPEYITPYGAIPKARPKRLCRFAFGRKTRQRRLAFGRIKRVSALFRVRPKRFCHFAFGRNSKSSPQAKRRFCRGSLSESDRYGSSKRQRSAVPRLVGLKIYYAVWRHTKSPAKTALPFYVWPDKRSAISRLVGKARQRF